jgi:hypothetical protein
MKIKNTDAGFGFVETTPIDAISLALCLLPGQGVINELAHDGPYLHGLFCDRPNPKKSIGILCPYCKAEVMRYEYAALGFCVVICKEIAFFSRLPPIKITKSDWARMLRFTAKSWTEIEANQKGGRNGGRN